MNYTVLIGDIQASKKINSNLRYRIQLNVEEIFETINRKNKSRILSPLKITLGDEFQAVFKSPEDGWRVIQEITMELNLLEIKSRFALVEDELYTKINKLEPLKMDGPAFWSARNLIEQKKNRYAFMVKKENNEVLNLLGEVLESIEDDWKKTQFIYIYEMFAKKITTITEIAKNFDRNKATISKTLKRSKIDLYNKINAKITLLLKEKNDF